MSSLVTEIDAYDYRASEREPSPTEELIEHSKARVAKPGNSSCVLGRFVVFE